jgi:hypothetical protein
MTDILALDAITGALADLAIAATELSRKATDAIGALGTLYDVATELSRKATDAIGALGTLYDVVESSPAANSALPYPADGYPSVAPPELTQAAAELKQLMDREYILVALGVKHTNLTTNYGPEPPPAVVAAAGAVQEVRVWLATRWDLGHMVVNGT